MNEIKILYGLEYDGYDHDDDNTLCPLWKDVTDLFGTDLPVEGGKGGEFAWRDGPLLAALKAGHWVVLDEVKKIVHVFLGNLVHYLVQ